MHSHQVLGFREAPSTVPGVGKCSLRCGAAKVGVPLSSGHPVTAGVLHRGMGIEESMDQDLPQAVDSD